MEGVRDLTNAERMAFDQVMQPDSNHAGPYIIMACIDAAARVQEKGIKIEATGVKIATEENVDLLMD
jgi:hypothetical protein